MPATTAGYSGTPLPKKLGLREGIRVLFVEPPEGFVDSLDLSPTIEHADEQERTALDLALLFVTTKADLHQQFGRLASRLAPAGMLWVAWPKKSSGKRTDLTENTIRDFGLAAGLVDVKICAIDETWSGLKFVIRLIDRPKATP